MDFSVRIAAAERWIWGPGTLALLMGTGLVLLLRTRFLPWRNLGWALRSALGREARTARRGGVSPFSALMTSLAATIGTGNIVGVATALVSGGPGALVWMELSSALGLASKFAECLLAVRFRETNGRGEPVGGPMYVMRAALRPRWLGRGLAALFALFAVLASFGIGCLTQSNSIADALSVSFALSRPAVGTAVALLALAAVLGGIRSISRISSFLVPFMAVLYLLAGTAVILGNLSALPGALAAMLRSAFSLRSAGGGAAGTALSALDALRCGVSRSCFSNEAGMGSAAVTAAAADCQDPVRQGYISMTAVVFDTAVICTVSGLAVCCAPVPLDGSLSGAALTAAAFSSVLGRPGAGLIAVCITLFAFSTILGWEYIGEKALEYLAGERPVRAYRTLFALCALPGALWKLETVWGLSDLCNALMAIPNLLCLLTLSGLVAGETLRFHGRLPLR